MVDAEEIRIPVRMDDGEFNRKWDNVERRTKAQKRAAEESGRTPFQGAVLGGAVGGFAGSIIGGAADTLLGPLLELAIGLIVATLLPLIREVLPVIRDAFEWIKNNLGPAIGTFIDVVKPILGSIADVLRDLAAFLGAGAPPEDQLGGLDWKRVQNAAVGGAVVGGVAGAAIGSVVPGVGTAIGGAAGFGAGFVLGGGASLFDEIIHPRGPQQAADARLWNDLQVSMTEEQARAQMSSFYGLFGLDPDYETGPGRGPRQYRMSDASLSGGGG